jgi:hypothetical protein
MKLPKTFVPEKDLESKTEGLLTQKETKKKDVAFTDYTQIRYTTEGTSWSIEYEGRKSKSKWVLYDKDFYENKWFKDNDLDDLSRKVLKNRIAPLVELLNLKEKDYSLEKDSFKSILDRYATKVSENEYVMEDKEDGKCNLTLYEKDNLMIELREFEKINLGRIDVLEGS